MSAKNMLPIEIGVRLQLDIRLAAERLITTVVGFEHGQYLLLKMPPMPASEYKTVFASGKSLVARYIYEGAVMGFRSRILGCVLHPIKLVVVQYPEEISDCNLRKHPRISCHLPSRIISGNDRVPGYIVDISMGGCKFSFPVSALPDFEKLDTNADISMDFMLPGIEDRLFLTGRIRNSQKEAETCSAGILFVVIPDQSKTALNVYLAEAELYGN